MILAKWAFGEVVVVVVVADDVAVVAAAIVGGGGPAWMMQALASILRLRCWEV